MRKRLTGILGIVGVVVVVALAACTPPKPPPPPPHLSVTDFTINDGTNFVRNETPFVRSLGPAVDQFAAQAQNGGQVGLVISKAPGYADDGFYIVLGKLSQLNEIALQTNGSDPVSVNLWLDKGGDGDFFAWNDQNQLTGLNGDVYGAAATSKGSITVNDSTTVSDLSSIGGNFTLAQLKSGSAGGINGDTNVAVWVGICCGSGSQSAGIQSLSVNGVSLS